MQNTQMFEDCLFMYRQRLRQILAGAGVRSNPGVGDDWILDRIQELIPGPPPLTLEQIPAPILAFIGEKHGWDPEEARQKVARTQEILQLKNPNDAVTFLIWQVVTGVSLVVCDGCNVNEPHEHRCHGDRAMVNGQSVGKPCRCVPCFVAEYLLSA